MQSSRVVGIHPGGARSVQRGKTPSQPREGVLPYQLSNFSPHLVFYCNSKTILIRTVGRLEEASSEVLRAADVFEKLGASLGEDLCELVLHGIQEELNNPVASGELCEFLQMTPLPDLLTFRSKLKELNEGIHSYVKFSRRVLPLVTDTTSSHHNFLRYDNHPSIFSSPPLIHAPSNLRCPVAHR
jgi:hypothetical protein